MILLIALLFYLLWVSYGEHDSSWSHEFAFEGRSQHEVGFGAFGGESESGDL
jgi:hypothetical protein